MAAILGVAAVTIGGHLYGPLLELLFAGVVPIAIGFGTVIVALEFTRTMHGSRVSSSGPSGLSVPQEPRTPGDAILTGLRHGTTVYVAILVLHLVINRPDVLGIGVGSQQVIIASAIWTPLYYSATYAWVLLRDLVWPEVSAPIVAAEPPAKP